jgi:3-methylfumaryl-CoA hydratase
LLTEFARAATNRAPSAVRVRHLKPLFCRYPITLVANLDGSRCVLKALNEKNAVAIDMEMDLT